MYRLLLSLSFLGCGLPLRSQPQDWLMILDGSGEETVTCMVPDGRGHLYFAGSFMGSMDTDPGPDSAIVTSAGAYDFFVGKTDTSGNLAWIRTFGAAKGDQAYDIEADGEGNVYVTGRFLLTVDFDPGEGSYPLTAYNIDMFVLMLDSSGNFVRAVNFGGDFLTEGRCLETDPAGNLYAGGYFWRNAGLKTGGNAPTLQSAGDGDIFLCKFDAALNLIRATSFGGPAHDEVVDLLCDKDGNLYACGRFSQSVDFDAGKDSFYLHSAGEADIFLMKTDSAGHLLWARGSGSPVWDSPGTMDMDSRGNLYLTGFHAGTLGFGRDGTRTESKAKAERFVAKVDTEGELEWVRSFDSRYSMTLSVAVDPAGNVLLAGYFDSTRDFDPGPGTVTRTAQGRYDAFLLRLDSAGTYKALRTIGGRPGAVVKVFAALPGTDGQVYMAGGMLGPFSVAGEKRVRFLFRPSYDLFVSRLRLE